MDDREGQHGVLVAGTRGEDLVELQAGLVEALGAQHGPDTQQPRVMGRRIHGQDPVRAVFGLGRVARKKVEPAHAEQGLRVVRSELRRPLVVGEGLAPVLLLEGAAAEEQVRPDVVGVELDDVPSLDAGLGDAPFALELEAVGEEIVPALLLGTAGRNRQGHEQTNQNPPH